MPRIIDATVSGNRVKVNEDVFVRDRFGVRRQAFFKGDEVAASHYNAVVGRETVLKGDGTEDSKNDLRSSAVHNSPEEAEPVKPFDQPQVRADEQEAEQEEGKEEAEAAHDEINDALVAESDKEEEAPKKRSKKGK